MNSVRELLSAVRPDKGVRRRAAVLGCMAFSLTILSMGSSGGRAEAAQAPTAEGAQGKIGPTDKTTAPLEARELKVKLDLAKATQQQAEADYKNAHLVYERLEALDKAHPNLVAQQEMDNAKNKDVIAKANLALAQAEVEKRKVLVEKAEVVASLDVRRLNAELGVAKAAQQKAEADYRNSHLLFERLSAVDRNHANLISQEDLENAKAKDAVAEASLSSAKVEVEKCQKRLSEVKGNRPSDAKGNTR